MLIGETYPIKIKSTRPGLDLNDAAEIIIRVLNNKKKLVDYLQSDGDVSIDTNDIATGLAFLSRADSLRLVPGEMLIEMLAQFNIDPDYPTGAFVVAQMTVTVERAFITDKP